MATNFRRTKLERFVKRLEEELPEIEQEMKDNDPHGMGMYYQGIYKTQKGILGKLKREFNLKDGDKG